MSKSKMVGLIAVGFLCVVLIVSSSFIWGAGFRGSGNSGNYLTETQLNNLNVIDPGIYVSNNTSTVYINSSSSLPVMMGPMNSVSMYSFEILSLINPQIIVRNGTEIHFTVVNIDDDSYHNFVMGTYAPPYPHGIGGGMMFNGQYSSMMQYLPPVNSGHYAYANFSYDFTSGGTFWYLCTYPGHAQNGMYGKIIVT